MHHSRLLHQFRTEAEKELKNILSWWMTYSIDRGNGGFFGKIDDENNVDADADKGSVLNGRILWTFSSAYIFYKETAYLDIATRAFHYIINHFIDPEYGGAWWTVNAKGQPAETKKQVYASAFILYGLSEYYRASGNEDAKHQAIKLYSTVTQRSHDHVHGGFFEAFTRDWKPLNDQRLSGKDANAKKSMNTNLHVLEAFANLYRVWPDEHLKYHIRDLLKIFIEKIIDSDSGHLKLFFDEQWSNTPALISYGHDIEAAWLLLECALIIEDKELIDLLEQKSVLLTLSSINAVDEDGGLWYEYDLHEKKLVREKHWWPQSEAIVGFLNAWEISGDERFLATALNNWHFIKSSMLNPSGEWYWGILEDGRVMQGKDKAGLWKCPYHNSRGCMEIVKRINRHPETGSKQ